LQSARAAVAASDFVTAREALLEHARRFPAGQLAEEREALRVKTLLGLGRAQDARRAARAFEARFPDSVLGPAVTRLTREPL
jgi:TolA-binding protein